MSNIEEIKKELGEASALDSYASSEGGKILLKSLSNDILVSIETLADKHSTMTLQEFISLGASIKEKLAMFKAVHNSKKNKEFLKNVLKETMEQ
jgi:hypothetical protein